MAAAAATGGCAAMMIWVASPTADDRRRLRDAAAASGGSSTVAARCSQHERKYTKATQRLPMTSAKMNEPVAPAMRGEVLRPRSDTFDR